MHSLRDSSGRFVSPNRNKIDVNEVLRLYIKGNLGYRLIGRRLGFSAPTIRRIIKHSNVEIKKPGVAKGTPSPNNKGGTITPDGYKLVFCKGKRLLEHRLIWMQENQVPIPKGWEIHHKNGNGLDNRIDNLALLPHEIHSSLSSYQRWN